MRRRQRRRQAAAAAPGLRRRGALWCFRSVRCNTCMRCGRQRGSNGAMQRRRPPQAAALPGLETCSDMRHTCHRGGAPPARRTPLSAPRCTPAHSWPPVSQVAHAIKRMKPISRTMRRLHAQRNERRDLREGGALAAAQRSRAGGWPPLPGACQLQLSLLGLDPELLATHNAPQRPQAQSPELLLLGSTSSPACPTQRCMGPAPRPVRALWAPLGLLLCAAGAFLGLLSAALGCPLPPSRALGAGQAED